MEYKELKMKLKEIVIKQTFRYADKPIFTLSSGEKSQFYFDCKKTTLDPDGANLIGELLYKMLEEFPNVVGAGGLTLGADPMAASLMHVAFFNDMKINQFIVRKELKKHGAVKWIEGNMKKGDKVLVLDDVITTGGSVIQAIEKIQEDGLDIEGVIVLIDREEFGGIEKIKKLLPNKPIKAILKMQDMVSKNGIDI